MSNFRKPFIQTRTLLIVDRMIEYKCFYFEYLRVLFTYQRARIIDIKWNQKKITVL